MLQIHGGSLFSGASSIMLQKSEKQLHLRSSADANKVEKKRSTTSTLERLTESVIFSGDVHTDGTIATTASGTINVNARPQWKMIVHEDFHKGTVEGWSNVGDQDPLPPDNTVSTCASPGSSHILSDYFLGGYGSMVASKVYSLPSHTKVRILARFHFIDSWEGESGFMKVDGKVAWSQSHNWCNKLMKTICQPRDETNPHSSALSINVCGHPDFPDKLSVPIMTSLNHADETIRISFGSNLLVKDGRSDVSWGVDDVMIFVM
jgi:hypothetical protein